MRLLALLVLALAVAIPAAAQDATTNETPASDERPAAEETPTGNETATANKTPAEGPAEPIVIELEGHQDGRALYFTKVGETARNPTLTVKPGQKVTFKLTIVSGVHNLNVADQARSGEAMGEGESATFEWTAPETPGTLEYWCDPHKSSGMRGRVVVASTAPATGGGESEQIEGPTVDLGQYDPACAGKVAPANAANGETGLPTLQDYIDRLCRGQDSGGEQETVDPYKGADYVIPISWALIGLGVVGVVWVHKYYKP